MYGASKAPRPYKWTGIMYELTHLRHADYIRWLTLGWAKLKKIHEESGRGCFVRCRKEYFVGCVGSKIIKKCVCCSPKSYAHKSLRRNANLICTIKKSCFHIYTNWLWEKHPCSELIVSDTNGKSYTSILFSYWTLK